jgi:hypothetical protein
MNEFVCQSSTSSELHGKKRRQAEKPTPHPGVEHPEAIEADYQMKDGMLVLNMRAPLVGYALRRWSVDCTLKHGLDPKQHHLYLKNSQTLYGVESAALAPGYSVNIF